MWLTKPSGFGEGAFRRWAGRALAPLVKARGFGMTPAEMRTGASALHKPTSRAADGGVRPTQTNFKSSGRGRPPYTDQLQEQRTGASALHRPTFIAAVWGVSPTQTHFKSLRQ